jgi:hypothetical protein
MATKTKAKNKFQTKKNPQVAQDNQRNDSPMLAGTDPPWQALTRPIQDEGPSRLIVGDTSPKDQIIGTRANMRAQVEDADDEDDSKRSVSSRTSQRVNRGNLSTPRVTDILSPLDTLTPELSTIHTPGSIGVYANCEYNVSRTIPEHWLSVPQPLGLPTPMSENARASRHMEKKPSTSDDPNVKQGEETGSSTTLSEMINDLANHHMNGVAVVAAPAAESIAEPTARARHFP